MKIKTNNKPRPLIYGAELTDKQREEFDYYDSDELDCNNFFIYKKQVYDLSQFIRTQDIAAFKNWQGYASDSYFSGIVVKYTDDNESIIVGRYYS